MKTFSPFVGILILLSMLPHFQARADETSTGCSSYVAAVEPDKSGLAAVVPDDLIADQQLATVCLVDVLRGLGKRIRSVADLEQPSTKLPLLSATSALRRLISNANGGNELKYDPVHLKDFIGWFRGADDLDVVSALSYAARSSDKDLRLNAVLILGNVIDNSTVCVPLTQLNDVSLLDNPAGVNGRANLLGVVSVVVPWAYQENFESITATVASLESSLGEKSDTLQTLRIVNNVKTRSLSQKKATATNKDSPLAKLDNGESLLRCRDYVTKMNPPLPADKRVLLKY